jgi:hypothetical protein
MAGGFYGIIQKLKGAQKYFIGKDSAWTWNIFQVDEDEGSSSQDEAKPAATLAGENRQISGSPSGVPHPSFFPLQGTSYLQRLRVIARTKSMAWQNKKDTVLYSYFKLGGSLLCVESSDMLARVKRRLLFLAA